MLPVATLGLYAPATLAPSKGRLPRSVENKSWQAVRDTATEPRRGARDWQLVAAGGGDAKALLAMQRDLIEWQRSEVGRLEQRIAELEARIAALERD